MKQRIKFFQKTILSWFLIHRREFPWRRETDPFKILIAEMMLQRTRAEQVAPVYSEFIKRFDGVNELSSAMISEISKYFNGLGLSWRGRQMISAANFILKQHNGLIPSSEDELLKIPGVGNYISEAIQVFAYNKRLTVVDSNVIRIVSRFFGITELKSEMRRDRQFRKFCNILSDDLKEYDIRDFNWGLIDFAALTCKPIPKCTTCPLSTKCIYLKKKNKS